MRSATIKNFLIVLLLTYSVAQAVFADDHLYHTGILTYMANEKVVIAGRTFVLMPSARVVVKYKQRGAYYERKGSMSEVHLGDRVYLKATGNRVSEILVVR